MALKKCKECGKEVSTSALACPSCGAQQPKKTGILTWIATAVVATIAVAMVFAISQAEDDKTAQASKKAATEAAKTPEQRASEAAAKVAAEADFQFAVKATKMVKASLKNPSSFELVEAGLVDKGALCLTYSGTNNFNATVRDQVAITRALQKGSWNKDCAGKTMANMRHVRSAIF